MECYIYETQDYIYIERERWTKPRRRSARLKRATLSARPDVNSKIAIYIYVCKQVSNKEWVEPYRWELRCDEICIRSVVIYIYIYISIYLWVKDRWSGLYYADATHQKAQSKSRHLYNITSCVYRSWWIDKFRWEITHTHTHTYTHTHTHTTGA